MTADRAFVARRPSQPGVVVVASPLARDREYLRRLLERDGIRIVEASTYREALGGIGTFGASLVLCDESIEWRNMLGYLAETCYPPLVVVVAASPSRTLYAEVLNLGGDYVLSKPFDESEVDWLTNVAMQFSEGEDLRRKPVASKSQPALSTGVAKHI